MADSHLLEMRERLAAMSAMAEVAMQQEQLAMQVKSSMMRIDRLQAADDGAATREPDPEVAAWLRKIDALSQPSDSGSAPAPLPPSPLPTPSTTKALAETRATSGSRAPKLNGHAKVSSAPLRPTEASAEKRVADVVARAANANSLEQHEPGEDVPASCFACFSCWGRQAAYRYQATVPTTEPVEDLQPPQPQRLGVLLD